MPPSSRAGSWLGLYVAARLGATGVAATLLAVNGGTPVDVAVLLYGAVGTLLLGTFDRLRGMPAVWALDFAVTLGAVVQSGDWRSPFYLLWLTSLALPAVSLALHRAVGLAAGAAASFLVVAVAGGPAPGRLELISTETLAIHLALPFGLVCSLAYAADALRRLGRERTERERLAIEAERRRIAWELHDSAKQRLHAAHLLVTSLQGQDLGALDRTVDRAAVELESAATDMDTSLAELRSPLEGRPLHDALRARASELSAGGRPRITIAGSSPPLPPLVGAHVYRIACEAITNALRHADAANIAVALRPSRAGLRLSVVDDGRGLPAGHGLHTTGLAAMESRAATIGAGLSLGPGPGARGTAIELDVPLELEAPA
jgi:two-component system sensor histidine kinase UhpB